MLIIHLPHCFIPWLYPSPLLVFLLGDWETKCNQLQKMLILRSLRQDRVSVCVTSLIVNNLGPRFVEPSVLDMKAVSVSWYPFNSCCFSLSLDLKLYM